MVLIDEVDSDQWYHLYVFRNDKFALHGTRTLGEQNTQGAVTVRETNLTQGNQQWQIYRIEDKGYALRCKLGGPNAFVGAKFEEKEEADGHTRPIMMRGDVADESVYWSFGEWGDGTYYLTNAENGTDWHLSSKEGREDVGTFMDSNIEAPQNLQRWSLKPIRNEKIKDNAYSTINLLGATVTSPAPSPTTSDPTGSPTGSPNSSGSEGLSTGAKAGIGVAVGLGALIAFIVLGLFFWRRRRNRSQPSHELAENPYRTSTAPLGGDMVKYEMNHDNRARYEMPATQTAQPAELPLAESPRGDQSPVELPNTAVNPDSR